MAWNGSDSAGQPANGKANRPAGRASSMTSPNKAQGVKHGLVALLIIVALGGAALWFFTRPVPKVAAPKEPKKPTAIKQVTPASASTNRVAAASAAKPANAKPVFTDGRTSEWSKKFSQNSTWTASTNSFGKQIEIVWDGGKMHKRISDAKPPMFNNASDQALAMATVGGNGPLPPIPVHAGMEKMFRESLKQEIVINDDDPYEVKLRKADVINARQEMKRRLDAGESFESVINATVEQRNADYSLRQEARSSVANMMKDDPEGAEELITKYNEVLRKNGISELSAADFEHKGPARAKENK